PDHANVAARKGEKNFERGGSVAAGGAMVFEKKNDRPRGNNPGDKQENEIDAANRFPDAAEDRDGSVSGRTRSARCAEARNLQPRRRFFRRKSASKIKLLCFFAAQFPAGRFGNAAGRNQFDAIGRQAESLRNLFGNRGGDGRFFRELLFTR